MKKTEVYSWRVDSARKSALENEARREGKTIAALLDDITKEWIDLRRGETGEEAQQLRLHARADKTLGTIAGKDPKRAARARNVIRKRLQQRRGR